MASRPTLKHNIESLDCQRVSRVLARVGDKWSVLIIMSLGERSMRFNEMRRAITGISQRMLTLTLRALERDGLVSREVTPSIPPRVDYRLTEMGRSLCLPVQALGSWAQEHSAQIEAAQEKFENHKAKAKP
jgi:DNA-binding HxlR family transcriptional regulator